MRRLDAALRTVLDLQQIDVTMCTKPLAHNAIAPEVHCCSKRLNDLADSAKSMRLIGQLARREPSDSEVWRLPYLHRLIQLPRDSTGLAGRAWSDRLRKRLYLPASSLTISRSFSNCKPCLTT